MRPTLSDLSKQLGVSEATVSLAINGKPGVSEKTRKKILQAAKELGYTPNYFASSLASQKSKTIGLIIPEIDNPYYSSLTQMIEYLIRDRQYNLIIGFSGNKLETEEDTIKKFIGMRVEGIIISPSYEFHTTNSYKELVEHSSIPILYVGAYYDFKWNYVMTNLAEGSYLLTDHLLTKGYKNIKFLSGNEHIIIASEREKGFKNAYSKHGLLVKKDQIVRCPQFNYKEAYKVTLSILENSELPNAIITINDIMALGVMRSLSSNGIKIPKDIAVAGYDDVIFSQIAEVPLTTICQPIEDLANLSVKYLFEMITKGKTLERIQIEIPPELIIRKST